MRIHAGYVNSPLMILGGKQMEISIWGSTTAQQLGSDPISRDSKEGPAAVAVCSTFVKNYQEKLNLSSTNATWSFWIREMLIQLKDYIGESW